MAAMHEFAEILANAKIRAMSEGTPASTTHSSVVSGQVGFAVNYECNLHFRIHHNLQVQLKLVIGKLQL